MASLPGVLFLNYVNAGLGNLLYHPQLGPVLQRLRQMGGSNLLFPCQIRNRAR